MIDVPGLVDALFERGLADVETAVTRIAPLFDDQKACMALRLALLGLAEHTRKESGPSFAKLHTSWNVRVTMRISDTAIESANRAIRNDTEREKRLVMSEKRLTDFVYGLGDVRPHGATHALLALLAVRALEIDVEPAKNALVRGGLAVFDFVQQIQGYINSGTLGLSLPQAELSPGEAAQEPLLWVTGIDEAGLVRTSRALFGRTARENPLSWSERSYYVVYRYSSERIQIVKTLLRIDSPGRTKSNAFSYAQYYRSDNQDRTRRYFGTVLSFDTTIYLAGLAAQVTSDDEETIDLPQGLNILAAELSSANLTPRLVPAVFLSNALHWQPIVGRAVMVHVGYESDVGVLTEHDLRPQVLVPEDSSADPMAQLRNLEGRLAKDLQNACERDKGTNGKRDFAALAAQVLKTINNRPQADSHRDLALEGIIRSLSPEDGQPPRP